ncbi:MAG: DUF1585 domain-containing protein [Gemmataceae bacterium]|nr:DUF1585 domain-containing protein [Gemmataceae bacterium]
MVRRQLCCWRWVRMTRSTDAAADPHGALGRSVVLSDEPLLQEMQKNLRAERRFSVLFETVVLSPQFRRQRGWGFVAAAP